LVEGEKKGKKLILIFFVLNATFSYIMATSVSGGGREPPTMGKQLVNFITCGCKSSAPCFVIYKAGREPTPYWC
jgi:hypothetical protein